MSSIQVADQTFVAAPAERVADAISSPSKWRQWWPDLTVEVRENRGPQGFRWTVTGAIVGTMEVWLEPALDGVILHYFLHAEPVGALDPSDLGPSNRARRVAGKRMSFEVKALLEAGRAAGEPPA
ncbi:SRPBCC family protein [Antrihabitans spumae]|uniref:SRPBCC family protein n=1 Tax=Antrihabitans spumae TaxID=3373370 RepID=A0ABW7JV69_9NOCA